MLKKEPMSFEMSLKQIQKQLAENKKPVRKSGKSSATTSKKTGVDNKKRKKEVKIERNGKTHKLIGGVKTFALRKIVISNL